MTSFFKITFIYRDLKAMVSILFFQNLFMYLFLQNQTLSIIKILHLRILSIKPYFKACPQEDTEQIVLNTI